MVRVLNKVLSSSFQIKKGYFWMNGICSLLLDFNYYFIVIPLHIVSLWITDKSSNLMWLYRLQENNCFSLILKERNKKANESPNHNIGTVCSVGIWCSPLMIVPYGMWGCTNSNIFCFSFFFFQDSSWERWDSSWEHPRWFYHRPEPKHHFLYCMPPW